MSTLNPKKAGPGLPLLYVSLASGAVTMLLPFVWMLSTSLKTPGDVYQMPPKWVPATPQWHNYIDAWRVVPFGRFYLNSLFVAATVTFGQVATSTLAAYAFARLQFRGRDKIFFGYLATLIVPGSVTMIPQFILLAKLGWIDSYAALILPGIFSAYGTFMLRQFFMGVPRDLEDAARIDGCGYVGTLLNVILPLSQSALATLAVFTFMGNWGSFLWPLVVTHSLEKKTLPVGLAAFSGQFGTQWPLMMAASAAAIVPVVFVFLIGQRYFTEGVRTSGFGGT